MSYLILVFKYLDSRCASVTFCSEQCRDQAWASHHRWECAWSFMDLHQTKDGDELINSSMFLAYRAMTLKNIQFFLENRSLFDKHDTKYNTEEGQGKIKEYLDKEKIKYKRLFNLVTHEDEGGEEFHLKNAVITIFFLQLLEQNFWFEEYSSESWTDEKSWIAAIIFHLLCVAKV